MDISIPRDHSGEFEPQLIKKPQTSVTYERTKQENGTAMICRLNGNLYAQPIADIISAIITILISSQLSMELTDNNKFVSSS